MLKRIIFGIVFTILIAAAIAITLVIILTRKHDQMVTSTHSIRLNIYRKMQEQQLHHTQHLQKMQEQQRMHS